MENRKPKVLMTVVLSVVICSFSSAQTLISIAGDTYFSENYNIQWSIGEQAISSDTVKDQYIVTQGFNQPTMVICDPCDESILPLTDEEKQRDSDWIIVYPNPVMDFLNAETKTSFDGPAYLAILNGAGSVMRLESIIDPSAELSPKTIDVEGYIPGRYYLRIFGENFSETTSFIKL